MRRMIVGVIGAGESASAEDCAAAHRLGQLIAGEGWVLLNGGRPAGVMEASARGAREKGGLTVGILPDSVADYASRYIDIQVVTGMGSGRNYINVLSSDFVVALPGLAGTVSEIALALKSRKTVILLNFHTGSLFDVYRKAELLFNVESPEEAINMIRALKKRPGPNSGYVRQKND